MGDNPAQSYIRNIKEIDGKLKQLNATMRQLRSSRERSREKLYHWMKSHHHEEYEGFNLQKLTPKQQIKRKKPTEKKRDAIMLFESIGVADPESFYSEFIRTQKNIPPQTGEGPDEGEYRT